MFVVNCKPATVAKLMIFYEACILLISHLLINYIFKPINAATELKVISTVVNTSLHLTGKSVHVLADLSHGSCYCIISMGKHVHELVKSRINFKKRLVASTPLEASQILQIFCLIPNQDDAKVRI